MKRYRFVGVLAMGLVLSGLDGAGLAQVWYGRASVEWLTASSDVVVQGTIVDLSFEDIPIPGMPKTPGEFQWATVTMKVQTALKGTAPQRVSFVMERQKSDKRLPTWKESSRPVIWFFTKGKPSSGQDVPATQPAATAETLFSLEIAHFTETVIPLDLPGGKKLPWPCMSMDLTVLDEDKPVLEAIKAEAVRDKTEVVKAWAKFTIPSEPGQGHFSMTDLEVPANSYLEKLARRWATTAADDFLKPPADWHPKDEAERRLNEEWRQSEINVLRCDSIEALRFFKSDENIALLKSLLAEVPHTRFRDQATGVAQWEYYVRRPAAALLTEWKVEFEMPVAKRPIGGPTTR